MNWKYLCHVRLNFVCVKPYYISSIAVITVVARLYVLAFHTVFQINISACDLNCVFFYTASGFSAAAIAGSVTTTSLVVGNVVGTPNATTLGNGIKTIINVSVTGITVTGGIPTNTVGVPIMKVCKH